MPALSRKWWYFRLAVLAFAATGIGFYLFHSTPWRKALGIQPDYRQQMAEGDQIVAAIYAFQYDTGLWPQYLEDLKLPAMKYAWFYEVQALADGHRQPALSVAAPAEGSRAHLGFEFGPFRGNGDWHVFTSNADRIERPGTHILTGGAPPARSLHGTHSPAVMFDATLRELERRIAREPGIIDHYQEKVSFLMESAHLTEARQAIADMAAQFPNAAWPRLAAAALDVNPAQAGFEPESLTAFAQYADAHPTFSRYFALCWLYRSAKDPVPARRAMARAIELPIEADPDDRYVAAFRLYDMARWALENELWNLALDVCTAWERAAEQSRVRDQSWLALRAAAEVGLGRFPAARADMAKFRALDAGSTTWISGAAESLAALETAAAKSDATFRLTFPDVPGEFRVFIPPE
jgi:hypothetical protein